MASQAAVHPPGDRRHPQDRRDRAGGPGARPLPRAAGARHRLGASGCRSTWNGRRPTPPPARPRACSSRRTCPTASATRSPGGRSRPCRLPATPTPASRSSTAPLRREDVYDGSELHRIPDILIDFGERPYVASDRLAASSIVERLPASGGGGRHRRYGIVLAAGPGVEPGTIDGANIVDLAPTALHAMGLPVPDDRTAAPSPSCSATAARSSAHRPPTATAPRSSYTPEEEAAIQASLENLGEHARAEGRACLAPGTVRSACRSGRRS